MKKFFGAALNMAIIPFFLGYLLIQKARGKLSGMWLGK